MNEEEKQQLLNFMTIIKKKGAIEILALLEEDNGLTFTTIKQKVGLSDKQNAEVLRELLNMGLAKKVYGVWMRGDMGKQVLSDLDNLGKSISESYYQFQKWMEEEED